MVFNQCLLWLSTTVQQTTPKPFTAVSPGSVGRLGSSSGFSFGFSRGCRQMTLCRLKAPWASA